MFSTHPKTKERDNLGQIEYGRHLDGPIQIEIEHFTAISSEFTIRVVKAVGIYAVGTASNHVRCVSGRKVLGLGDKRSSRWIVQRHGQNFCVHLIANVADQREHIAKFCAAEEGRQTIADSAPKWISTKE